MPKYLGGFTFGKGRKCTATNSKSAISKAVQGASEPPRPKPMASSSHTGVESINVATPAYQPPLVTPPMVTPDDEISRALSAITSELNDCAMPPGYYYIILDDVNHALALISYIALRGKRTVCGLSSDQNFADIRKLLARITNMTVDEYNLSGKTNRTHKGRRIDLRSYKKCHTYVNLMAPNIDCLVFWGCPNNAQEWVLKCFGWVTRVCMILTTTQYEQVVKEQPGSMSSLEQHPFSKRLNNSLQIPELSRPITSTIRTWDGIRDPAPELPMTYPLSNENWPSVTSNPSIRCPLPEGHYHIVLHRQLDTIPLISYLALQSTKTICYIGTGSSRNQYQKLLNQVTGIETMTYNHTWLSKVAKAAMQSFKLAPRAIMLRPADDGWRGGFRKSPADCVIYCGAPNNPNEFRAACLLKAKYSYLIISPSQSATITRRESPESSQHPSSHLFNEDKAGSVLHELRLKTKTSLGNRTDSLDQYEKRKTFKSIAPFNVLTIPKIGVYASDDPRKKKYFIRRANPKFLTLCDLPLLVHAHPKPPLGHHFIQFDREFDATVFTAYMALISRKTICVIPQKESLYAYAEIFKAITTFNILYSNNNKTVHAPKQLFRTFGSTTSPTMLLVQNITSHKWLKSANPDCIVHWGIPNDLAGYTIQAPQIGPSLRSYFLFRPSQMIDALQSQKLMDHGVFEYPNVVTNACFSPRSPFQAIHKVAAQLFATKKPWLTMNPTSPTIKKVVSNPISGKIGQPRPKPGTEGSISRFSNDMSGYATHSGHFYIILRDMNDAIALISYIALCSKKIICALPDNRNFEKTQKLLEHSTGLNVTICTLNDKDCLRTTAQPFTQCSSGILLRRNIGCYSLTRLLKPNCLVFWGLPRSARIHAYKCLDRISLSYVILTKAQHDQLLAEEPIWRWYFKQHPLSEQLNSPLPDSPLHRMRVKLKARPTTADSLDPFFTEHILLSSLKPHDLFSDPQLLPWSDTSSWEGDFSTWVASKPKADSWDQMSHDEFSDLRGVLRTYPKLPAGRKYIKLDRHSDVIAFTACMALQSEKTICVVSEHVPLDLYARIFELVTESDVLCYEETNEDDSMENLFEAFRLRTSPAMLLHPGPVPNDVLKSANPGCVLYWGFPSNFNRYLKQMSLLGPAAQSCLVLFSGEDIERFRLDNRVTCYPKSSVKNYLGPESPFREVRTRAFQALSRIITLSPSLLNDKKHGLGGSAPSQNHNNERNQTDYWRHMEGRAGNERSRPNRIISTSGWGRARAHEVEQELLDTNEEKQLWARNLKETRKWVTMHRSGDLDPSDAGSKRKRNVLPGARVG